MSYLNGCLTGEGLDYSVRSHRCLILRLDTTILPLLSPRIGHLYFALILKKHHLGATIDLSPG